MLKEVFFDGTAVIGIYGNSLMGVAPQRPSLADDTFPCVFEPFPATTRLELVDEQGDLVEYGERGRVRLHLVSDEMFLPNILERDSAVRIAPAVAAWPRRGRRCADLHPDRRRRRHRRGLLMAAADPSTPAAGPIRVDPVVSGRLVPSSDRTTLVGVHGADLADIGLARGCSPRPP